MTESRKIRAENVLDQDVLELLGGATAPAELPQKRMRQLRDRVVNSIDDEIAAAAAYVTIRADEGRWIEIQPLMEKKVLSVDEGSGIESYLLRLHPGVELDRHQHEEDELCIVLEGDVSFDDVHLGVGDYHLARKGSWHGSASTVNGALLFLQSAVAPVQLGA